jgi:hypothetical protein
MRGRDRREAQSEPREPVQHIGRRPTHHRPACGDDPANGEVATSVSPNEERKARQAIGIPAERRIELRGGVQPGLVGLHDPHKPIAVDRPLSLHPLLVAHEPRHRRRISNRDPPGPSQQRRLDGGGHEVGARSQVVEQRPNSAYRLSPEDRVADEAIGRRGREQRLELGPRPRAVKAPPGDRGEARVPVPLPGIAVSTRRRVGVPNAIALALPPIGIKRGQAHLSQPVGRRSPVHLVAFRVQSARRYPRRDKSETGTITHARPRFRALAPAGQRRHGRAARRAVRRACGRVADNRAGPPGRGHRRDPDEPNLLALREFVGRALAEIERL